MKLYTNGYTHTLTHMARVVLEYTQQHDVELVIVSEEENKSPEMKAKKQHGNFPMLELSDGTTVLESMAIAAYLGRRSVSHSGTLMGYDAFEQAKVNSWMNFAVSKLFRQGAVI